ncbi:MAG: glycosyltransferase family 1 protein [Cytophagales bacterium]|nr:glycosyltransferase family 1 protein [Cytophagales bacterium]
MKKILVDAHVLDGEFQGTKTFIIGLYKSILKLTPQSKYYFVCRSKKNFEAVFGNYSNAYFIKSTFHNHFINLNTQFYFLIFFYKIDIAHFQYIGPLVPVCKYVTTIHDLLFIEYPFFFSVKYVFIRKILFRYSSFISYKVNTVSTHSKISIADAFKIQNQKIFITPNAVDEQFYKIDHSAWPFSNLDPQKYILYISRFEPRKNHHLLLNAYLNLKLYEKGIKLVFVGKKSLKNIKFEYLYNQLSQNIKINIFHFEQLDDVQMRILLKNTKLFVYPSLAEGFGIPPLEAAAMKVTVMCSNVTAMSEFNFFEDLHFNPYDISEFELKLKNVVEKPVDKEKLNLISQTIQKKYNWDTSAKIFIKEINL